MLAAIVIIAIVMINIYPIQSSTRVNNHHQSPSTIAVINFRNCIIIIIIISIIISISSASTAAFILNLTISNVIIMYVVIALDFSSTTNDALYFSSTAKESSPCCPFGLGSCAREQLVNGLDEIQWYCMMLRIR